MSATSRGFHAPPGDTDDVMGKARSHATLPRDSVLYQLVETNVDARFPATAARLALGIVMFPHAMQKMFGWFGGYGFSGTFGFFTSTLGIPTWLAGVAILTEFCAAIMLLAGVFTRVAAAGIMAVMIGAILFVHLPNGFFMNWSGDQAGEGFEYHLLAIGLSVVCIVLGGGFFSVDAMLKNRWPAEGGGLPEPVTRD